MHNRIRRHEPFTKGSKHASSEYPIATSQLILLGPDATKCKEFPQESGELTVKAGEDNKRRADAARDEMTKEMAACQAAFPGGKDGINAYYSTHK